MLHGGNLTPTQIEAAERSKAFHAKIAEMAETLKAPEDIIIRAPAPVESLTESVIPTPWFSMASIGEPLPASLRITVEKVQRATCAYFSVRRADMLSPRRSKQIVMPRHIAVYIAKELTLVSLPYLGRRFGNRDHTSILHAIRKIEALIKTDSWLAFDVATITYSLIGDLPQ